MTLKVAIIGGGVNGFSCAVRIAEYYGNSANVTIISEDFTPNTTGDGSAGLWGPYLCGGTNPQKIMQWSRDTHKFLHDLWLSESAGESGICLMPVIRVTTDPKGLETFWKDIVFGFEKLSKNDIRKLSSDHGKNYTDGVRFISFTSEPVKLLPYLMKRFKNARGKIIQEKITNLYEFAQKSNYDIVINCTGLDARNIVPDPKVHPIRGQVTRVKANWIFSTYLDESDDGNYIIPNCDSVVLGGTHQINDYNIIPNVNDRVFIQNGCKNIVPGLKLAQIICEWVGLRPGRDSVRLEKEIFDNGKILIHNYGHGGSGVTLAWGCSLDVLNLLRDEIKSKL